MKVVVRKREKRQSIDFPCLMISNADDEEVIIIATGYNEDNGDMLDGTIISPDDSNDYPLGEVTKWTSSVFVPFYGTVTITS